jgi:hypothetical protein
MKCTLIFKNAGRIIINCVLFLQTIKLYIINKKTSVEIIDLKGNSEFYLKITSKISS